MIGAVLIDNIVQNIIVMDETQVDELSAALGAEIVDARPYGLGIGDVRQGDGSETNPHIWVRNAGGDNLILPLLTPKEYDSCTLATERALMAQEKAEAAQTRLEQAQEELTRTKKELVQARSELSRAQAQLTASGEKELSAG